MSARGQIRAARQRPLPERVRDACAEALMAVEAEANEWGGWDYVPASRSPVYGAPASSVRVTPLDGDWSAGFEARVFDAHFVLLAEATVRTATRPRVCAAIAAALWGLRG